MTKNGIKPYIEFVHKLYNNRDCAHDFNHIKRMIKHLNLFMECNKPFNIALLYFLVCFHGLNKRIRNDSKFSKKVKFFLKNLNWTNQEINEGFLCLERHLKRPKTIEEKIVHDSNFIELLGAFGIAKAFTAGGAKGQTYEETINIFKSHYLNKIKFQTVRGRKLAKKGRAYVNAFLIKLQKEL